MKAVTIDNLSLSLEEDCVCICEFDKTDPYKKSGSFFSPSGCICKECPTVNKDYICLCTEKEVKCKKALGLKAVDCIIYHSGKLYLIETKFFRGGQYNLGKYTDVLYFHNVVTRKMIDTMACLFLNMNEYKEIPFNDIKSFEFIFYVDVGGNYPVDGFGTKEKIISDFITKCGNNLLKSIKILYPHCITPESYPWTVSHE